MNILRQYSLPNCTLILEGFDDGTGNSLQTLAVLSNVECRFTTSKQVLNGGKVFFDHLVRSVSEYAQGLLSGMQHPIDSMDSTGKVSIETTNPSNVHRLVWQEASGDTADSKTNEVHLTTAELFDLTEAIDQFLADGLTLPDFVLPLTPLSRRYSIPEQSLAERVTPPLIGISGFALTVFALFFAPIPETTAPIEEVNSSENIEQTSDSDTATEEPIEPPVSEEPIPTNEESDALTVESSDSEPEPDISSDSADLETLVASVPEIDDSLSLAMMQTYLYRTISDAWEEREDGQKASYRVSLGADGSVVGSEPIAGTSAEAAEGSILSEFPTSSADQVIADSEPVAQFRVVFDDKILEVSPWKGSVGEVVFDNSQVRGDALRELVTNTRRAIAEGLEESPVTTSESLRYSVGVTDDGAIAFYVSENAAAETLVNQTPLPGLIKPEAAGIIPGESIIPQEPLTQVNVVFRPNGVIEVSPWAGYR